MTQGQFDSLLPEKGSPDIISTLIFPSSSFFCSSLPSNSFTPTPLPSITRTFHLPSFETLGWVRELGWAVANHILSRFLCFQVISSWCFAVLQFFAVIIIANYQVSWTEEPGRLQSMGSQRVRRD